MKDHLSNREWNAILEISGVDTAEMIEKYIKTFGENCTGSMPDLCMYYYAMGFAAAAVAAGRRRRAKAGGNLSLSEVWEADPEDLCEG